MGSLSLLQGNLPYPGIEPVSPALQVDSLPAEWPGKPFKWASLRALVSCGWLYSAPRSILSSLPGNLLQHVHLIYEKLLQSQQYWVSKFTWRIESYIIYRNYGWDPIMFATFCWLEGSQKPYPHSMTEDYLRWKKVKVKSLSHVRLFATPWTVAHQAPPSMEFSRQEYCSGLPFPSPGYLPDPGIEPRSPALQADALLSEPARNPI